MRRNATVTERIDATLTSLAADKRRALARGDSTEAESIGLDIDMLLDARPREVR
jgi:hypothetical protein